MSTHRLLRPLLVIASAAALVLGAAACSGDDIAERLAESASDGNTDVSIDSESGELRIDTEDGSMAFGNAEVPDDFPADVPLPDGYEVVSAISSGTSGTQSFNLVGTVSADAAQTYDGLVDRFGSGGWSEIDTGSISMGGTTTNTASFENADWQVQLVVASSEDQTNVTYTVTGAAG